MNARERDQNQAGLRYGQALGPLQRPGSPAALSADLGNTSPHGGDGPMAADPALTADPDVIDRSADPAGFVVQACQRARAWLRSVRRVVPFGPVRRPLPPGPGPGHPESLTADLPPEDKELLAAIEDENFPEP